MWRLTSVASLLAAVAGCAWTPPQCPPAPVIGNGTYVLGWIPGLDAFEDQADPGDEAFASAEVNLGARRVVVIGPAPIWLPTLADCTAFAICVEFA